MMSLTYFFIFPLAGAFLSPLLRRVFPFVSFALSIAYLVMSYYWFDRFDFKEYLSYVGPVSITFSLSAASWFFMATFSTIYFFYTLFHLGKEQNRDHFIMVNLLVGAVFGLVLSSDIFNIYIFFEIVSICAYILTSSNQNIKAYSGAIKYMIIGSIASLFLLLGIMVIYLQLGTLSLYEISQDFHTIDEKLQFFILLCLFVGFGIKAEIFPLNFWVADIYEAAPSHITALFSSIVSKAYIFTFFNIAYSLGVDATIFWFFSLFALTSFIVAEMSAFRANSVQRVFAYSTLGQIGIIFFAFSFEDRALLSAGLFLIFAHALAKLNIFLAVDILRERFKNASVEIFNRYSSILLSVVFTVSFLSIVGIPPFAGFVAKLNILLSLAALQNYIAIAIIVLISLVEGAYLFRLLKNSFDSSNQKPSEVVKLGVFQKLSFGLITALLIYLGIYPEQLLFLTNIAAQYFINRGLGV